MQYLILMCGIFLGRGDTLATMVWIIVLFGIYYGLRYSINSENIDFGALLRRREAIRIAKIYLTPHRSIWKNMALTNKHCRLVLGEEASIINASEKVPPYRRFSILSSHVHSYSDLWDMFCKSFSFSKTYEGLKEDCYRFRVSIKEFVDEDMQEKTESQKTVPLKPVEITKKVDINNSSEIELTELPGINIVMAKKIIAKREEIGGFKSIEQVFEFLNLKSHHQEQIKDKIIITKKQGSINIKKTAERNIDL